ncbi:MAG: PQQ-like beta-propeller repeat protein [Bacteroidetes bacterium]|nr:PQQ-like beta-propeller repeat protein [Bacteroidota bacterium]
MKHLTAIIFMLIALHSTAQITAQWRGPNRDGIFPGNNLPDQWTADGPAMLWSAEGIGKGYSSAVSDGKNIFVTGMKEKMDVMTCLSMDGKILWQTPIGEAWNGPFPETRTTPTVDGDRVYAISGGGIIACMETSSGKVLWSLDGIKTFEGVYGTWGVCESPLIYGDKIIYTPAGNKTTMAALDKMTGKTIWMSESLMDTTAYVSPRLIKYGGKEIIVTLTERWFFGVDASTGKILWKYDFASLLPEKGLQIWPGAPRTNTNTPLYDNGMIYITGGYDHAGSMFRLSETGDAITQVWVDTTLDCHHGGVVKVGDYIYGSNWLDNSKGNWCCIDWKTGKTMYEQKWCTKGAIIASGNMLYCFDEKNGTIGLVRATPEKFDLVSSLKVTLGKGPFWAHPAIYNGMLIVRHGDVVLVYKLI